MCQFTEWHLALLALVSVGEKVGYNQIFYEPKQVSMFREPAPNLDRSSQAEVPGGHEVIELTLDLPLRLKHYGRSRWVASRELDPELIVVGHYTQRRVDRKAHSTLYNHVARFQPDRL